MKKLTLVAIAVGVAVSSQTQLKTTPVCPEFKVDVLNGKVNDLPITSTPGQFKSKFPCSRIKNNPLVHLYSKKKVRHPKCNFLENIMIRISFKEIGFI